MAICNLAVTLPVIAFPEIVSISHTDARLCADRTAATARARSKSVICYVFWSHELAVYLPMKTVGDLEMLMFDRNISFHCVEVSGWDQNKTFFVENSQLEWNDALGKRLTLRHALSSGAVIFLRLMQAISPEHSYPVAYSAELVGITEQGSQQFLLHAVSPNRS